MYSNKSYDPRPSGSEEAWLSDMVGVLTGHCKLQIHLHILSKEVSPICQNCLGVEQNVNSCAYAIGGGRRRKKILGVVDSPVSAERVEH